MLYCAAKATKKLKTEGESLEAVLRDSKFRRARVQSYFTFYSRLVLVINTLKRLHQDGDIGDVLGRDIF